MRDRQPNLIGVQCPWKWPFLGLSFAKRNHRNATIPMPNPFPNIPIYNDSRPVTDLTC
ncbi:MAG: hypothetical protein F6J93_04850 [Oscillatoria sp. SIO1A7]|nr:hypothetical protein [Oscillatoria sp. SIO1A7]